MNVDGSGPMNVICNTAHDACSLPLTCLPDSTQILFSGTTIDPQTADIYSINLDGSNLKKLTNTGMDWYTVLMAQL
jgi:hypothetical protein